MTADEIRGLFDYTEWANDRMFTAIRKLSGEQCTRTLRSSYPTVRETLAHIVFAEWMWLERWKGANPAERPAWYASGDVDTLENVLRSVAAERRRLLDSLDEDALDRPLHYRTMKGDPFTNRLADVLFHLVNHSTYHRGQLVTMIREVGGVPPSTDLIVFRRDA